MAKIAQGAELLALPNVDGGLEDLSAFHALMLLIRTGRRINEVPSLGRHSSLRWRERAGRVAETVLGWGADNQWRIPQNFDAGWTLMLAHHRP